MKRFPSLLLAALACLASAFGAPPPLPLAETVDVNGIHLSTQAPPPGLVTREALGLVTVAALDGQVVHRTTTRILETRATITPKGDYLLMFPEGDHYAKSKGEKINTMMACRSTDKGRTWTAPAMAYDIPYSQHGFIPFIPRGTKRIHAFGTQPIAGHWTPAGGHRENAAIGHRWSDDDGHTWSEVKLIAPVNDPEFRGMSVMRMTETDAGTWLLGSHLADWSVKPFKTKQYLLRSADKGETWTLLPDARPNGWFAKGFDRMDEGRPLNLGGGRVLFMTRTPQGHLFTAWSKDDGKTWTEPAPSSLVHPDAPPMVFPLSDGKTLVAFHHNRVPPTNPRDLNDHAETMKVRSALWVATSTDEGHTWSEPRFVLANAIEPAHKVSGFNHQCSYLDMFIDDGVMHLFLPHRWQQVLHLTLKESDLATLPTADKLGKRSAAKKASTPVYTSAIAANIQPTRKLVYKKIGDRELSLDIFEPAGFKTSDKRACFVSIHGGGWTAGSPRTMYPFTEHCAKLGMVAVSVQYRLYKPGGELTVFDCVKDARSAVRYIRAHAAELGIDPQKIVVNGSSAGGHLAAATAMFDGVDDVTDDLSVSCMPQGLVLFSPVIDTSPEGYGNAKAGPQWRQISPAHQVRKGVPPTIVFHGTADTTTPYKGAQVFHEAMLAAGNRCDLVTVEGAQHTYMFKDAALYQETLKRLDGYLAGIGMVQDATAEPFIEKIDLFKAGEGGYKVYHIPGILVTTKGSILAWCEARKKGGDWDQIEVLLRRSTDDCKTWSEPKVISHVPGPKTKNPFSLGIKSVDPKDVTYNNPVLIADKDGTIHMLFCLEYMRCFYQRSNDDGLTWSVPTEITATFEAFRKDYDWKVLATGPDHGIQIKSGRLIVPVWLSTGTGGNAHRPSVTATVYSDDQGKTWKASEIAVPCTDEWINPNETTAVELADGSVMLNVRNESKTHRRLITTSKDGATGWSTPRFDEALLEPICMGSVVRLSLQGPSDKNRLLFSNPDNLAKEKGKEEAGKNRDRKNVSVKLSYDEGQTWVVTKPVEPGWSAYSDIGVSKAGTILCFYGRGEKSNFAGDRLTLARFNLEWLTDGKDRLPK